jgi:hypothetical protein
MILVLFGSFSNESPEVVNCLFGKKKGYQLHMELFVACCFHSKQMP